MRIRINRLNKAEKFILISPLFIVFAFLFSRLMQITFLDYRPQKLIGHSAAVTAVEFSPDGKVLASASNDGYVLLWDTKSMTQVKTLACEQTIVSLDFSPNGKELLMVETNGQIDLWDITTGTLTESWKNHNESLWEARISPDNRIIVTNGTNFGIRIWDKKSGALIKEVSKIAGYKKSTDRRPMEFSPSGSYLATAIEIDGIIQIWDMKSFQCIKKIQVPFTTESGQDRICRLNSLCFSPDGKSLAASCSDIKIIDIQTGRQTFSTINDPALYIHYSPDGKRLVYIRGDVHNGEEIKIFDLVMGKCIQTFPTDIFSARDGVTVSPDGKQMAVALFGQNEVLLQKLKL